MKKAAPSPPRGLGRNAKQLWRNLQEEYAIVDAAGLDLLHDLATFSDRREAARKILAAEGITVLDRFGQIQAHPATRIERDASAAMTRILKCLNLDIEPVKSVGRPPGR